MKLLTQIEETAVAIFRAVLRANTAPDGYFRAVISFSDRGVVKPLLLLGNAHGLVEDGTCAAILNPDKGLLASLSPANVGSGRVLKERVTGRCDAMVPLWIDAYKDIRPIIRGARYRARRTSAPKFVVT